MTNESGLSTENPKQSAAWKAVEYVKDGMVIGLGTGSTAYWAILRIGDKIKNGLKVTAIASSKASEDLARQNDIPIVSSEGIEQLDIGIDGADEISPEGFLIKGGGGALVREKILAANCRQFIVIADESKLVTKLGKFPVPVEVIPFAGSFALAHLRALGCEPRLRLKDNQIFISDNGNYIADCSFKQIDDPRKLSILINKITGVVDNGIFDKDLVWKVITNKNLDDEP